MATPSATSNVSADDWSRLSFHHSATRPESKAGLNWSVYVPGWSESMA
jgi:hypothetical protein